MRWISSQKSLPLYVWKGDTWYNETNGLEYQSDFERMVWKCENEEISFPMKKCKIFSN